MPTRTSKKVTLRLYLFVIKHKPKTQESDFVDFFLVGTPNAIYKSIITTIKNNKKSITIIIINNNKKAFLNDQNRMEQNSSSKQGRT
jgi:hypothetical protein